MGVGQEKIIGRETMLKKIFTNTYVIAGIIVFVILIVVGILAKFPLIETLIGSAVLSVVGILTIWWRMEGL
jgi:hypothetical protein